MPNLVKLAIKSNQNSKIMKKILMGALAVVIAAATVNATNAKSSTKVLADFYYYQFDTNGDLIPGSKTILTTSTANPFGCDNVPDETCSRSYSSLQVDPSTQLPLNENTFTAEIKRSN